MASSSLRSVVAGSQHTHSILFDTTCEARRIAHRLQYPITASQVARMDRTIKEETGEAAHRRSHGAYHCKRRRKTVTI